MRTSFLSQIKVNYDLSNHLGSYTLSSFRLVLEGKTGKNIPELSRLFLKKFSVNNFALTDAEHNTCSLLNGGGIAGLPLLRTLLAVRQTSPEPRFWEVMEYFVLLAYASLAASRNLSKLYFRSKKFIFLVQTKKVISMNHGRNTSSSKIWK